MKFKNLYFLIAVLLGICLVQTSAAQSIIIKGILKDSLNQPVVDALVFVKQASKSTTSDSKGAYQLEIPRTDQFTISISHVNFNLTEREVDTEGQSVIFLDFTLDLKTNVLEEVSIEERQIRDQASLISLDPKNAKVLPSAFGDFNKLLVTLPGVTSNNELSSTYSVRGGNFDENLVYVNGIQIYRPFLIRSGQQEGLSFINTDLVQSVEFSAGGWEAKYGDKLASSLNVEYKRPTEFGGSASINLLGGNAHIEGATRDKRISYLVGVRRKSAQYLLNSLETDGQFLPRFLDVQSYITIDLDKNEAGRTSLDILSSYARNRYLVEPESRTTDFGTIDQSFRLFVAFEGQELLEYDTYQTGFRLSHNFSNRFQSSIIGSYVNTDEREFFDTEGGYRLCDLDNNPNSSTFEDCLTTLGIGTNFNSGRNQLSAEIYNLEMQHVYKINSGQRLEFGFGYSRQNIDDELAEFAFIDSADFVSITENINSTASLRSNQFTGYVQYTRQWNSGEHLLTAGVRYNYFDLNNQLLISPRLQYVFRPNGRSDLAIKSSVGVYSQPPFYRELRNFSGELNLDIRAQRSIHAILGVDKDFQLWGRNFKFLAEGFYKNLDDVVPFDIDNVRLRFFGDNIATAFAAGADFRVSGEFIPGAESWFSLGILNTRENVTGDGRGSVRRPTDQRLNLAIFFQDHIPNNPSIRVYLNLLFSTGLPFSPPNQLEFRNVFNTDAFRRVDVGFSKIIDLRQKSKLFESIWLSLEVLNLIGAENTISFLFVEDFQARTFAVPNTLSARFLNAKFTINY